MVSPPALTDSRSKIITLLTDTAAINLLALFTVQTWRRDMAPYFPTKAPTLARGPRAEALGVTHRMHRILAH